MRKLTSNYTYTESLGLLKQSIIEIEEGQVKTIIDTKGHFKEVAGLEFYSGVLVVGEISMVEFNRLKNAKSSCKELFDKINYTPDSVLLLTKIDFVNMRLKEDSEIKRYL